MVVATAIVSADTATPVRLNDAVTPRAEMLPNSPKNTRIIGVINLIKNIVSNGTNKAKPIIKINKPEKLTNKLFVGISNTETPSASSK